jgi:sugar phosphate isomerase/epimerase
LYDGILFGMPTLIECRTIEENIHLCKELELDFIELNMNLPQFQIENIDGHQYKDLMEEHGIFFTIHLPEELNIADFNSKVRKAYLDIIHHSIIFAKEIGAPIINMHMVPGVYFTLPRKKIYLFQEYFETYLENVQEYRDLVERSIGDSKISMCIENIGIYDKRYICKAVEELLKSRTFKLTWDIGHDHSSGCKDTRFILSNSDHIAHFHIHDAMEGEDHLPLGRGQLNIAEKIALAKHKGSMCVIETKTIDGLRESVEFLRE